ncbi:MAG: DNA mismatch repair endonuclease MutL [Bacteroidales bacterium]|nr:DNA mismatch repair endonuclease MutL [Bacteroidales bacterium]
MLQVLPQHISNLIAAGEVVSRPASVVKELMENAVDAGATSIVVSVLDAGKTLIQVIDDGCGMSSDDAVLCFERHATSKIAAAEDLEKIQTYGFRGEALPSIAAVAEVTLRTRRPEDEIGTMVEISGANPAKVQPVAAPSGTHFAVRNLFFNVPARRKFLKSDNAELRAVIQEFLRIALIRPELAFKLTSNGKEIHNLRPASTRKKRILDIYGMNLAKELVEVKVDTSLVRIGGYVGNPEDARKSSGNQFFFVNGRYFRSPFFHKAVCKPYEKLIPDDYTPAYFLFLETEPQRVDVNIHPAKTEVKFEDEGMVFEIIMAAVREALGKNDFTPSIDFDMKGAPDIPIFGPQPDSSGTAVHSGSSSGSWQHPPRIDYSPLFNPFDMPDEIETPAFPAGPSQEPVLETTPVYGRLFEETATAAAGKLLVLQRRYIVTPVKSGMMVVDIRRARQRIYYERYLERIAEQQPVRQQSLFPVSVKLSAEDCLTLLEQPDLLTRLGFDIQDFGGNTVVVNALPEGYPASEETVRDCLDQLIAALRDDTSLEDQHHLLAAKMAESAAASGTGSLNAEEAQLLVDQLFACREPKLTPDGRRCMTIITFEDLEKKL